MGRVINIQRQYKRQQALLAGKWISYFVISVTPDRFEGTDTDLFKLQALVYDILPLEEDAEKRCSECQACFDSRFLRFFGGRFI